MKLVVQVSCLNEEAAVPRAVSMVVDTDGDNQYPPHSIPDMVEPMS